MGGRPESVGVAQKGVEGGRLPGRGGGAGSEELERLVRERKDARGMNICRNVFTISPSLCATITITASVPCSISDGMITRSMARSSNTTLCHLELDV